jgi:hypothetical protein
LHLYRPGIGWRQYGGRHDAALVVFNIVRFSAKAIAPAIWWLSQTH